MRPVLTKAFRAKPPPDAILREAKRRIHTAQFYTYHPGSFVPLVMQTQTPEGKGVKESLYFYQNDPNGMPLRLSDANGVISCWCKRRSWKFPKYQ